MTTIYWSKSRPGFYADDVMPKTVMPSDVVEVAPQTYQQLLSAQSSAQTIGSDADGNPVLVAVAASP